MDELLKQLSVSGVRCLLTGGQAMRSMGMPRYSMDWDSTCILQKLTVAR